MQSDMQLETRQIAERVNAALVQSLPPLPSPPQHLYTLARGSSDHAAMVIHRFMATASIAATTMPPSLLQHPIQLLNSAILAISQSGASPDIYSVAGRMHDQGVPVVALVNQADSALERVASVTLQQMAGEERAVAATKSFICSVVMGARLAQVWGAPDCQLHRLPEWIQEAQQQPIEQLVNVLISNAPVLVIGRGFGLGVACEIALKMQELLGRPAMAYSSAEVLHGPAGMIQPEYPVLAVAVGPEANSVLNTVAKLEALGANVLTLSDTPTQTALAPVVVLSQVYLALEAACIELGRSPDRPNNLSKVTLTH